MSVSKQALSVEFCFQLYVQCDRGEKLLWSTIACTQLCQTSRLLPRPSKVITKSSTTTPPFCLTVAVSRNLWTNRQLHPQGHDIGQRLLAGFGPNHSHSWVTAASRRRPKAIFRLFSLCRHLRSTPEAPTAMDSCATFITIGRYTRKTHFSRHSTFYTAARSGTLPSLLSQDEWYICSFESSCFLGSWSGVDWLLTLSNAAARLNCWTVILYNLHGDWVEQYCSNERSLWIPSLGFGFRPMLFTFHNTLKVSCMCNMKVGWSWACPDDYFGARISYTVTWKFIMIVVYILSWMNKCWVGRVVLI